MEKVEFSPQIPRETKLQKWATTGKTPDRERNIITSLFLESEVQELLNKRLQKKYREIEKNEVRFEKIQCDNTDYLIVAFGLSSRICLKSIQMARLKGLKVGLFRPISLYPFPYDEINKMADKLKGILTVEMNAGQMVEDVKLAVNGKVNVDFYGRMGGMIPSPEEVVEALEQIKNKK
jgi:2-oxoglutarate ferredoxin oxidoreductase subunit alpha